MNSHTQSALGLMLLVTVWFGFQAWFVQSAVHASSALAFNAERFMIASVLLEWHLYLRPCPCIEARR